MQDTKSFYYDPQRQGYDTTLWKTVSGTPTIAANMLVLNAATVIHYGDLYQARAVFNVSIPSAPTGGNVRFIGLGQLNDSITVGFYVNGTEFGAISSDGSVTTTVPITWKNIWTATYINLEVRWKGYGVTFYIDGVKQATINSEDPGLIWKPLSLYIDNAANSDDLSIKSINVLEASKLI